jgi:hypothetical protein
MKKRWYELVGRKPDKKARKVHLGEFSAKDWARGVRAWRHYRDKKYKDVTLQEITVTHELVAK